MVQCTTRLSGIDAYKNELSRHGLIPQKTYNAEELKNLAGDKNTAPKRHRFLLWAKWLAHLNPFMLLKLLIFKGLIKRHHARDAEYLEPYIIICRAG